MPEKEKVPAIRFKDFTDAWEQRKLGECFDERQERSDFGELISVTINSGIKKFEDLGRHDNSSEDKSHYKRVEVGDIAYNSMRMWQGASGYSPYSGIVSPAYTVVIPNEDVDSLFFSFMFKKPEMIHTFQLRSQGITSDTWNMKYPAFSEIEIRMPKKPEQSRIAKYFSQLDNLITLHQRKLLKLKNIKKAMLEKMFPKNGSCVPEIRFVGFTDAWEQRKLREVVDVRGGKDYKHLSEGDIPVYGTGGYMLSVNEALSYKEDAIGIGRKGTIDKPYILKAPFWTVDTLFYAIPREKYDLDFAFDLFQNINWKKKDESTGVPSLSKTAINEIDVIVPKENEQKVVGSYFAKIDNLITLHQRKYEKLLNIKKACLEKMFV
ncbi:MAG: restriction endonuclease subunit S [Bacillota bacterium]